MPDQYQSSGAASDPPFGSLNSPTCQSWELVDVAALTGCTTCCSGSDPLDAQSPTVCASKSMSYAKLYQLSGTSWVDHCVADCTHQRSVLSEAVCPLSVPYLISVKWLYINCPISLYSTYMYIHVGERLEREVYLKESNLMLETIIWRILTRRLQREMVVQVSCAEILGRLRDDLRPLHVLSFPEGRSILRPACLARRYCSGEIHRTIVILIPCASLVSAGFLKSGDSSRYSLVGPLPWMYHCHGSISLDQDPGCLH